MYRNLEGGFLILLGNIKRAEITFFFESKTRYPKSCPNGVFDESSPFSKSRFTTEAPRPQRGRSVFFVHREIPMDEKTASDQEYDTAFLIGLFPKTLA